MYTPIYIYILHIYIYTCIYLYIYIHIYIHIFLHVFFINSHISLYIYIYLYISICIYIHTYLFVYLSIGLSIHIYIYIYTFSLIINCQRPFGNYVHRLVRGTFGGRLIANEYITTNIAGKLLLSTTAPPEHSRQLCARQLNINLFIDLFISLDARERPWGRFIKTLKPLSEDPRAVFLRP